MRSLGRPCGLPLVAFQIMLHPAMSLTNDSSAAETPMGAGPVESAGSRHSISSVLPWLRCPVDGTTLTWDGTQDQSSCAQISCAHGTHVFPIEADIPCLFAPNE